MAAMAQKRKAHEAFGDGGLEYYIGLGQMGAEASKEAILAKCDGDEELVHEWHVENGKLGGRKSGETNCLSHWYPPNSLLLMLLLLLLLLLPPPHFF